MTATRSWLLVAMVLVFLQCLGQPALAAAAAGSGSSPSLRGSSQNLTAEYTLLDGARAFRYYSYGEVVAYMHDLEARFPHLVDVTSAQEAFGLESPGQCKTLAGNMEGCQGLIVRLTNEATLPEPGRPEVFFSGCLHGDEQVGPIATVELAIALVELYATSEWARRMLDTRSIVIMPFPNTLGFEQHKRGEGKVDPNRDFPYNQKKCVSCSCFRRWLRSPCLALTVPVRPPPAPSLLEISVSVCMLERLEVASSARSGA
jgi:hypothetical protein